jgi:ribonuclease BN (tRNA processing enzyme)
VDVTVVGCSGSFPGPDSAASCYLVEHEGTRILLDLGNGALGALARHIDIYDVDAVVLSHLHVDHFIDLCSFYVALKYRPGGPPARPVAVWGPSDTGRRLQTAYGLRGSESVAGEFDIHDTAPSFQIGPFRIRTARVVHPIEAYAVRVEAGGRSLTYSGDTGPTDRLVDLARGSDLALFEASFLERRPNPAALHLTARQAARHAAAAGVDRLVLTHLVPWHDPAESLAEAQPEYGGELSLARPGLRLSL